MTDVTNEPTPMAMAEAFNKAAAPDEPEIRHPDPGNVSLVYGIQVEGERYRDAVVRELRGSDEEVLGRINPNAPDYEQKLTDAIVRRGTVSIGPVTTGLEKHLAGMLMVDRDLIFSHILMATYGVDKTYSDVACPMCGAGNEFTIHIPDYLDLRGLPEEDNIYVKVKLTDGSTLLCRYPTGADQSYTYSTKPDANDAERNTFMIERCIAETNLPLPAREFARKMSIPNRRAIVAALLGGPSLRFKEVSVLCSSCNEVIPFAFGWADLLFN